MPKKSPKPTVRKVTAQYLRRKWNNLGFQREFHRRSTQKLDIYDAPAPHGAEQPPGTRSKLIAYFDNPSGQQLGTFHMYVLPDGTLGASGKLDPKSLLIGDEFLCDP